MRRCRKVRVTFGKTVGHVLFFPVERNFLGVRTTVQRTHRPITIHQRLESKGEPVLVEPGKHIMLETATLQLEARVVDMNYGQGAMPTNSFFDRMTLELAIWSKV